MKKHSPLKLFTLLTFAATFMGGNAFTQSQTAQSVMVSSTFDSNAYIIEGTITWTFDNSAAAGYYTNLWDGTGPVVTCSGGGTNGCVTPPATPAAPAPDSSKMTPFLNSGGPSSPKCVFFNGGSLPGDSYTQVVQVNVTSGTPQQKGNWRFTYTYNITPTQSSVEAHTAWTSELDVDNVDVSFTGFVASESFLKQSTRNKYSFTMVDDGQSRAREVMATLQKSDGLGGWTDIADVDLNNVDTDFDTVNDAVAIMPALIDFVYSGNGGIFGNSAVFGALHAPGRKPANLVSAILNGINDTANFVDNFTGNNNDLAALNVHGAPFGGEFEGLTEAGDYRVTISGVIKGNDGAAGFGFSVSSSLITIGGCTIPE